MSTILLIILVLLLVGALPSWPYSRGWGYYPSGGLGLIRCRFAGIASGRATLVVCRPFDLMG